MLEPLVPASWHEITQFAGLRLAVIVLHLHIWKDAAVVAVAQPAALAERMGVVGAALADGRNLRDIE